MGISVQSNTAPRYVALLRNAVWKLLLPIVLIFELGYFLARYRNHLVEGCTFVPTKVPKTLDKNYWRELHSNDLIIPKVHVRLLPHSSPSLYGIIAPAGDVDSIAFLFRQ